jgi:tartrate-resistant acid phosphatase type 5
MRLLALVLTFVTTALSARELPVVSLPMRGATLRLAVVGDTGDGADTVAKGIARVHATQPLDAIILTGDNFYPCGIGSEHDSRWSLVAALTRVGPPLFPVLGNHDSCGGSDPDAQIRATGVVPHWQFPARQYRVKSAVAEILFLDTTPYVNGDANEVEPALASPFGTAPWRIAVGHHPILSSGYHGYFPRSEVRRMRALIPAVRKAGLDAYFCGHDHHLELIRGRMLLLVSGAGSEPIPPVKLRATTVYPTQIVGRERIGFAVVEIEAKRMRVRFYDADGRAKSEWIDRGKR